MGRVPLLVTLVALALPFTASAGENPVLLNHEGRLTDGQDQLVNGPVSFTFKLYDAPTGGTASWSDAWNLTLSSGLYSVVLGTGQDGHPGLDASNFGGTRYLAVVVGTQELSPRQPIAAVPLAAYAREAGNAQTLGGHPASDFLLLGSGGSLGASVSAGVITATDHFAGNLQGKADAATLADEASAPASSFTLDGSRITGSISTSQLSGTIPAASVVGALTNATIDGSKVTGSIATSQLSGAIPAAGVSGALTGATIDGSKITGTISSSQLSGTLPASSVSGALTNATIDGSKVGGVVANSTQLNGHPSTDFASAFSRNLQPGGTFEEGGLYYWTLNEGSTTNGTYPVIDSTTAHSGGRSLKLFSNGYGSSVQGPLIPVRAGARLHVSAWSKGNVTTGSQFWYNLYLIGRWYKADGSLEGPGKDGCGGGCPDLGLMGTENVSDWRYKDMVVTVPADAVYWRAVDFGILGSGIGTAWVDDVRVEMEGGGDGDVEPAYSSFKLAQFTSDIRNSASASSNTVVNCDANGWCEVPGRGLVFTKHRPDSVLRITYQDTLGSLSAYYQSCMWSITVTPGTGTKARPGSADTTQLLPAAGGTVLMFSAADLDRYNTTTSWMMQNGTHSTLVRGAPVGANTIQVFSYRSTSGARPASECLMGWNANGGYLAVEELISQP